MAENAGFKNGPYAATSYDAAALIALAMQAAKSSDSNVFKSHVFAVANQPGEKIYPGELSKGLKILQSGGSIDYVGASDVELIGPGESSGKFAEIMVENQKLSTVKFR